MRLRSAIPGRQRWDAPAIYRRPERAARLERWLSLQPDVVEARADALAGRVLVIYPPPAKGAPDLDVQALIKQGLAAADRPQGELQGELAAQGDALARALKLAIPDRQALTGPVLLSGVSQGVHIAQGLAFMATINAARRSAVAAAVPGAAGVAAGPAVGLALALTGLDYFVQHRRKQAWRKAAAAARQRLRAAVLAKIEAQDAAFFDQHGVGRLASVVTNDTQQIADLIEHAGDQAVGKVVTVSVAAVAMTMASPRLALLGALPLPLLFLPGWLMRKSVKARYQIACEDSDRFQRELADNFAGIADIKGFTAEGAELLRLAESDERQAESAIEAASLSSLQAYSVEGIFTGGYALTAAYAGKLASGGGLTPEALGRILYFYPQIASAVMTVGELTRRHHQARQAALRLAEIMDAPLAIRSGRRRAPLRAVKGEVAFENVSFSYAAGRGGIEDVSFVVEPGETVAIVGPTGSGKSTLTRLLPRHYDVDKGRILLDGRDIRQLNLQDLRKAIGLVRQDAFLFDGPVGANVRLGRQGASNADVRAALKAAQASELVAGLPGGLDAEVGPGGRRLSGGERQRLALARALLKQAPVLVLDEVTSSLDYATELAVKRAVRRIAKGRTLIIVAHRLSTIRDSDRIIVLDRGHVREQGTHKALLAEDGLYALLWRLQSEEERPLLAAPEPGAS